MAVDPDSDATLARLVAQYGELGRRASDDELAEASRVLDLHGLTFPPLLARVLAELGSGRVLPGVGQLVRPRECVRRLEAFAGKRGGLLPFADWGCGITSLVDCDEPDGVTWWLDPNAERQDQPSIPYPSSLRLSEWFAATAQGINLFDTDQWPPPWLGDRSHLARRRS